MFVALQSPAIPAHTTPHAWLNCCHSVNMPVDAILPKRAQSPIRTLAELAGGFAGLSLYSAAISCLPAAGEGRKKKRKGQRAHRSAFLFTHRGYSGPSVLDLSHIITMALERGTAVPGKRSRCALNCNKGMDGRKECSCQECLLAPRGKSKSACRQHSHAQPL